MARMPIRMAPRTFIAPRAAMMKKPRMANRVGAWVRSPKPTLVAGLATTMPAEPRAMMPRNSPMPAAMADLKEAGMPATSHSRAPVTVRMTNTTPEMKTAPSACCQE